METKQRGEFVTHVMIEGMGFVHDQHLPGKALKP